MSADELVIWTIYRHPTDYPESYVLRRWVIAPEMGMAPDKEPAAITPTLRECRRALPVGVTRLPREENDDAVIVESWI